MRWFFSRDVKRTESYSRIVRHTSASGSRLEARGMKDVAEENRTPYCVGITNGAHVARPGSMRCHDVDVRIIAATNQNSGKLVRERKFRAESTVITIVISAADTDLG